MKGGYAEMEGNMKGMEGNMTGMEGNMPENPGLENNISKGEQTDMNSDMYNPESLSPA